MADGREESAPPKGVDLQRPSVARVYDYYLGGTANWAIDREFGDRVLAKFPLLRDIAFANRHFLHRVVRYLTKCGIRQFLDIGAGVPTEGNTHAVADDVRREAGAEPDVRVVYVDYDPVAVAHATVLLNSEGDATRHAIVEGDLRKPEDVWQKAIDTALLDPDEPVALLLIAVLHVHQPDDDGNEVGAESVARLRELLPPGSYVAISHITDEGVPDELGEKLVELKRMYDESSSSDVIWRSHADIASLAGDFELVEPGWTWTPEWHPEEANPTAREITFETPSNAAVWAAVGQKAQRGE